MNAWVVVFRNVETGELMTVKVRAWSMNQALERAAVELAAKYPDISSGHAWSKLSVNRCES